MGDGSKYSLFLRRGLLVVATLVLVVLALRPLFLAGWYDDDLSNSLFRYSVAYYQRGWALCLRTFFVDGGRVPGRFFPFAGYAFLLFYLTPELLHYRLAILAFILLDLGLIAWLVKRLTGDRVLGGLTVLLVPACFQYREFYDPILSFHAMMPLILVLTLGSLLLLDLFLTQRRAAYLLGSVLLYVVSLLTYEITYAFFVLHLGLLWYRLREGRAIRRYATCFGLPLLVIVAMSVYTRHQAADQLVGTYKIHFVWKAYLLTLAKQLYAALPLSYFLSYKQDLFASFQLRWQILDLGSVALFLILYFWPRRAPRPAGEVAPLFALGLGLWILPAVLIALSPHYQGILRFGIAHLPVYLEYFGVVLVLLALRRAIELRWRSPRVHSVLHGGIGLTFAFIYLVNLQANRLIVERRNATYWYPRNVLEAAARHGAFAGLSERSQLLLEADDALSLDYPVFIYSLVGQRLLALNTKKVVAWETSQARLQDPLEPPLAARNFLARGPTSILKYWSNSAWNGSVVVAPLDALELDAEARRTGIRSAFLDVYVLAPGETKVNLSYADYHRDVRGRLLPRQFVNVAADRLVLQKRAQGISHYRVPVNLADGHWLDFRSVRLIYSPEPLQALD
jgi:hypothetical protein